MLNDKTVLTIGMISIALGILFSQVIHFTLFNWAFTDFMAGIFIDLSLVMNLKYLISKRDSKKPGMFA